MYCLLTELEKYKQFIVCAKDKDLYIVDKIKRQYKSKIKRYLKELRAEDYTAALDLIAEEIPGSSYDEFI